MVLQEQEKHLRLKHWQNNFINKITIKWFLSLMQVIKEVSMLLELKSKDLQAIKPYQSTII